MSRRNGTNLYIVLNHNCLFVCSLLGVFGMLNGNYPRNVVSMVLLHAGIIGFADSIRFFIYRIYSNNIIAPKYTFFLTYWNIDPNLKKSECWSVGVFAGITLFIEIVQHSNYWWTRIIWFSKIFIFSKIDKIFSYKISLNINNRRATIRGNTVNYLLLWFLLFNCIRSRYFLGFWSRRKQYRNLAIFWISGSKRSFSGCTQFSWMTNWIVSTLYV